MRSAGEPRGRGVAPATAILIRELALTNGPKNANSEWFVEVKVKLDLGGSGADTQYKADIDWSQVEAKR